MRGQQLRWQAVQRFSLGDQKVGVQVQSYDAHDCCVILCLETLFTCPKAPFHSLAVRLSVPSYFISFCRRDMKLGP